MSAVRSALLLLLLESVGCAHSPTLTPDGKSGPYVHADSTSGQVQAGLALPPKDFSKDATSPGWPPQLVPAAGACAQDRQSIEAALGVAPTACPSVEFTPITAPGKSDGVVDGEQPITNGGVIPLCYALGDAVLVVEYSQSSSKCTRMVGLAVFHNAKGSK